MHLSSSQQMEVKMIHCLSAVGAGVNNQPKTVVEVLQLCNFICGEKEFPEEFGFGGRRVCDGSEVLLGDDQDMHRRLWMNVGKRQNMFVLVEARDQDHIAGDLAEQAVRSCSHVRMLNLRGYFLKYLGSIPGIQGLYAFPNAARRPMAGWLYVQNS
jgi:hypothetical protein